MPIAFERKDEMKSLSTRASCKLKDNIEDQISAAEAGLYGERQIAYELRNSGMDMIVAHDLSLEKNDLSAGRPHFPRFSKRAPSQRPKGNSS